MAKAIRIRGKVRAHNISPRGDVEGLMVETDRGLVQVNLPKHAARFAKVGAAIDLEAEPHDRKGAHPVYEITESSEVSGTVARLNYSRHGEVNGYHLDDDTFVHVKPHGARRVKAKVGDKIRAVGASKTGAHATVIESDDVKRSGRQR